MKFVTALCLALGVRSEGDQSDESTVDSKDSKVTHNPEPPVREVRNATILTDDEFLDFMVSHDRIVINFHANSFDKRSQRMKGPWMKLVNEWPDDPPMAFGQLDVSRHKKSSSHISVPPHVVYYAYGTPIRYRGINDADHMKEWLQRVGEDPAVEDEVQDPDQHPAISIYSEEQPEWFEKFAAGKKHLAHFYWEPSENGKQNCTIHHDLEDPITLESIEEKDVREFVKLYQAPMVGYLTDDTWHEYEDSTQGIIWCLFEMDRLNIGEVVQRNMNFMMPVAKALKGKFNLVYVDGFETRENIEHLFNVKKWPAYVVQDHISNKYHYLYPGPINDTKAFTQFALDVIDKKVPKRYKSPSTTTLAADSNVEEATTYDVPKFFSQDRDTLVLVYAQWCGESKKALKEISNLSQKIKKDIGKYVQVFRFEGSQNDSVVDFFNWEPHFPAFKWIRAGSKKIYNYNGRTDWKSIWRWIKSESTFSTEIEETMEEKYKDTKKHDEL